MPNGARSFSLWRRRSADTAGCNCFADTNIAAGASWQPTIRRALDRADVAVLLVSKHFLSSAFIMDVEFPYILKARTDRALEVVWFLVSHCLFEETPLQSIQAALPTATPLEDMSESST